MNAHHRRPVGWRLTPPANRVIPANPKSAGDFSRRTPVQAKPAAKARPKDCLQPTQPHHSKRLQLTKVPVERGCGLSRGWGTL